MGSQGEKNNAKKAEGEGRTDREQRVVDGVAAVLAGDLATVAPHVRVGDALDDQLAAAVDAGTIRQLPPIAERAGTDSEARQAHFLPESRPLLAAEVQNHRTCCTRTQEHTAAPAVTSSWIVLLLLQLQIHHRKQYVHRGVARIDISLALLISPESVSFSQTEQIVGPDSGSPIESRSSYKIIFTFS